MSSAFSSTDIASHKHVLASRNFRLLWLGQAVSTFGDKFTEIAIPILIYSLTGSAMQLGLAFLVQTVATLMFGLYAGAMSDRWDRRRTMIGSDIVRAFFVWAILIVPLLSVSLEARVVLLYILSFGAAAVKQFFLPAKVAVIPDTVAESQLVSANSLDQSTMTLVGFFGFAAAGLLIEKTSAQTAFLVDGFTFMLSAGLIGLMRLQTNRVSESEKSSVIAGIKSGFHHVKSLPILRGTAVLSLIAPLAVGATQALLLIFAKDVLHANALGFGLLEGTFGLGIAFGAFVLTKFGQEIPRGKLLAIGVIGMGVGQILGVTIPLIAQQVTEASTVLLMTLALPFFFLGAAFNAAVFIGIRTIIQENTPREMIGRIFSVITVISSVALAIGASAAGLADQINVEFLLLFWAILLAVTGIIALSWRTFREA